MSDKVFTPLTDCCETNEDVTEIESLCLECRQNGTTRLLLTEIPFFKQVVIMSFECNHCGNRNNELQPAQRIEEKGVRFVVKCNSNKDLLRQVIKTEWAVIEIPEIEFEVKKQTGLITTIEGIFDRAINGLKETIRMIDTEDSKQKISEFLLKLKELKDGKKSFTFILTDISDNSFVENPLAPEKDPSLECTRFTRSEEEDKLLGIYEAEGTPLANEMKDEVLQFGTNCPNCDSPAFTNMKVTQIPHFKEVIIMATNCDSCGHKTNEVKPGAGIEDKGIRITLKVNDENDIKKDVIKSDTCSIRIPEFEVEASSSGSGRYTTVEGLIENIKEDLKKTNPFIDGDSSKEETREKLNKLFEKLDNLTGYTIILDDPCGNSYVDGALDVVRYERSFEQNEELGLNDIKTENYK
jgi:zinc finger protein